MVLGKNIREHVYLRDEDIQQMRAQMKNKNVCPYQNDGCNINAVSVIYNVSGIIDDIIPFGNNYLDDIHRPINCLALIEICRRLLKLTWVYFDSAKFL